MSLTNHYSSTQEVNDLLFYSKLTPCEKITELTGSTNTMYSTDATRLLNASSKFREGNRSELVTALMLRDVAVVMENICSCSSFDIFHTRIKLVEVFVECLKLTPKNIAKAVSLMDFDKYVDNISDAHIKKYILINAIVPLIYMVNKQDIATATRDIKTIIVAADIRCEELTVSSRLRDIIKTLSKEVPNMTYVKNMSAFYRLKDSASPINKE